MEDSILKTVREDINSDATSGDFDTSLITHINSIFSVLWQLGAGPSSGFFITGETETWSSYMPDMSLLQLIKGYVCEKCKLKFDPPANATMLKALSEDCQELEWRIREVLEYKGLVNET